MNNDPSAPLSGASDAASGSLTFGARLRESRKSRGLELDQVAQQLRMSVRQVVALEEENFAGLSSPAFVRGFIRNYAKLLGIAPEPVLDAYQAAAKGQPVNASIVLQTEHIAIQSGQRKSWAAYLAASLLVLLSGVLWWVYMERLKPKPVTQVAVPVVASSAPISLPENAPPATAPVSPVATAAPPAAIAADDAAVATAPPPVAQNGIQMVVSAPTWISVTDGTGKQIFNKNKAAGTEDSVDGVPPFKVHVGNVNGVQIRYKGKIVDMAPYANANVARFTLE